MAQSRFQPGQYIGPYRLIKKLGEGSFGEVWLAERASNLVARQVALKLPFDPDPALVRQEAQTWIHASGHPNIVPVWDADVDANGQVYIASEYIAGGSLTDWLDRNGGKAPSLSDAVRMMLGILTGLEHLHAVTPHPVIHRDLKPDNILLQGGIPRLTDFGIARVMRSTGLTQNVIGTLPYMAPEAFSGKYNEQSDLWAAGVIFHQMLTGALPFPQTDRNALMYAIVHKRPDPLPSSFPFGVRLILERVFQKAPASRYASAVAMRTGVEALLHLPPPPPRRTFLLGMAAAGAAACGIYAINKGQPLNNGKAQIGGIRPGDINPPQTRTGGGTTQSRGTIPDSAKPQQAGTQDRTGETKPKPVDDSNAGNRSKIKRTKTNLVDGAAMMWIPAGTFQMGGDGAYSHLVSLSGFWMHTTPVTVAQFRKYDEPNGNKYDWNSKSNRPFWGWQDDHPMVNVSWTEASDYARWVGGVLPTEAQWEYAARGGLKGKKYPWGDDWDGNKCANSVSPNTLKGTKPVPSYAANGYGLYNMAGNVLEWCADWYDKYYDETAASGPNPTGAASGSHRVLRGGSWNHFAVGDFRCACRDYYSNYGDYNIGFRCCAIG